MTPVEAQKGREKARNQAEKLMESSLEKAIKKAIDLLIKGLTTWDESGLWGRAYNVYYTLHIKVFTRLLITELRYHGIWTQLTALVHGIDDYKKSTHDLRRSLPSVPSVNTAFSSQEGRDLVDRLDGWYKGTQNVIDACADKVEAINAILDVKRPWDIFAFVLGEKPDYQARNDLCTAVLELMDEARELIEIRNAWARTQGMPYLRDNLRQKMSKQCPNTAM